MSDDSNEGVFTLATQGGITLVGNITRKILGFVFIAVATRLVSQSEYGIFVLGVSVVTFAQGFASLNMYRSIDYFVPKYLQESDFGKAKKAIQNVFIIGILSSSVAALLIILFRNLIASQFGEPELAGVLFLFAMMIPLLTIQKSLLASFNSIKDMRYRVLMKDIINPLVRMAGAVVLVVGGGLGILGLISGYILGYLVAVSCGAIFLLYEAKWLRRPSGVISNWTLISYSLPLTLAAVMYIIVGQIDFFMIGFFQSSENVGQYRVAHVLATNLLVILTAITPIFKPMVAEAEAESYILQDRFRLATRWVTMLTLPPAITLILAPEVYLAILFPVEYTIASSALVVLSIGYLMNAAFGPEGMMLEGLGYTRLTFLNSTILVATNSIINILLIPRIGILGAAIGTGSGLTIAGTAGILEIYLMKKIHPFGRQILKVYVSAIVPIIIGYGIVRMVNSNILLAIFLPTFVLISYLLILTFINGFSEEDAAIASAVDERIGHKIVTKIIRA